MLFIHIYDLFHNSIMDFAGARVYILCVVILLVNGVYSQDCPFRWHKNNKDPTSPSCYLMTNSIYRTWRDARRFCRDMGGDLIKVDTVAEWNWLQSLTSVYHRLDSHRMEWWIGLHDNPAQSRVVWIDKSGINSQIPIDWYAGEPTAYDHTKACVEYYIPGNNNNSIVTNNNVGVLRHQSCSSSHSFVCERPKSSAIWCDAANGWENINGMCYKVLTRLMTWDDARSTCRSNNADLMVVKDASTQATLYNLMELKRADMWIGLRAYQNSQGNTTFRWGGPSGTQIQRSLSIYWGVPNPIQAFISSNGSRACVEGNVVLANPKVWVVSDCAARMFSICQKRQGYCAAGWIQSQSRCYYMATRTKLTWSGANDYCKQRGADLLQIKGPLTQDFINKNMADLALRRLDSIWLGLYDNNTNGNWRWGDNSPFTFSPYAYNNFPNGQLPVNTPGQAECFNMFTDDTNGTWQIAGDCMANKSFVCDIYINRSPIHPTPAHTTAKSGPTTTPAAVTWSNECGVNWILDSSTGYCYKFMDNTVKWSVARLACVILHSQLTSINTAYEQRFIADRLFGYKAPALWIGVNNLNTQNGYQWIDGTGFGYMNWAPGEPNNHGYRPEKCGEIVAGGPTVGKWNDNRCDAKRGYICKKKMAGFPTYAPTTWATPPAGMKRGCPNENWIGYKGQCFLLVHTRSSWPDAGTYCQDRGFQLAGRGFQLASIADENEQNFVFSQLGVMARKPDDRYDLYWIGLNDRDNQMQFSWNDSRHVTYTNWAPGEPDNAQTGRQDCVSMHKQTGTWQDVECDTPLTGFICKTWKSLMHSEVPQYNPSKGCATHDEFAYGYSCYQFIRQPLSTWASAKSQCQANGGHLAEIHDRWQQAFIGSQAFGLSGNFWIGLRIGDSDHMVWDSGARLDFTAWSATHTGRENSTCVSVQTTTPGSGLWVNSNCSLSQGYICQTPRTGYSTVHVTTPTTTAPITCATGWHEFNGSCYKGYTADSDKRSFFDARDTCRSMGTHLVSIHSKAEENFAFSYRVLSSSSGSGFHYYYSSARSFWIGLNDFDVERGYKWTDGSPFDYQTWGKGEPNDPHGLDDCVDYNKYGTYWNDNNCYIAKAFVCKVPLGMQIINPPSTVATTLSASCGGSDDWHEYNGSCYYVSPRYGSTGKKTWYDARSYCLQQGGDLASIHTELENGFIVTMVTSKLDKSCWLGMNDVGVDQFAWSDGTPWNYEKWHPDEPNDSFGSEKCGQLYAFNGYWNDYDCNDQFNFICKKTIGKASAVIIPPTSALPGNCPPNFTRVPNANKCYKIFGNNKNDWVNYTSARDACRNMGKGFDIASIGSKKEQAMLLTIIEGTWYNDETGVWIGLNDLNHDSQFTWQDSSPLTMTNWGKGQPGYSYRAKCVEMYTDLRRAGKWHNLDCGSSRGYVCQATPSTSYPTQTIPGLPCNIPGYTPGNGANCYKLHLLAMNWTTAVSACRTDGANLVSIVTVFEQAYVDVATSDIGTPVWIGLGDTTKTGSYSWVDNWPVSYSAWDVGEPSSNQASESCVITNNGYWNDTICSMKYPFFCKHTHTTPPPIAAVTGYCKDKTWKQLGNYCYYLSLMAYSTWANAESSCRGMGMELASIMSRQEELFILRMVDHDKSRNNNVWIGMRKMGGYFRWSDMNSARYIHWNVGQPSDMSKTQHQDCVELEHESGKWNDARCTTRNGYVCKAAKLPVTSSDQSTTTAMRTTSTTTTTSKAATTSSHITSTARKTTSPSTTSTARKTTSPSTTSTARTTTSPSTTSTARKTTSPSTTSTVRKTTSPSTTSTARTTTSPSTTSTARKTTSPSTTSTVRKTTSPSTTSTTTKTTSTTMKSTSTARTTASTRRQTFSSSIQSSSTSINHSPSPQSSSPTRNSSSTSTSGHAVNTLPTGFERITATIASTTTSKPSTAAPRTAVPRTAIVATATTPKSRTLGQTAAPQAQGPSNDLSTAQVGGLIGGVLAGLLLLCAVLLYVKKKSGDQMFSHKRLSEGPGFDNVMYEKEQESTTIGRNNVKINGATNGLNIGLRNFSDDSDV